MVQINPFVPNVAPNGTWVTDLVWWPVGREPLNIETDLFWLVQTHIQSPDK